MAQGAGGARAHTHTHTHTHTHLIREPSRRQKNYTHAQTQAQPHALAKVHTQPPTPRGTWRVAEETDDPISYTTKRKTYRGTHAETDRAHTQTPAQRNPKL